MGPEITCRGLASARRAVHTTNRRRSGPTRSARHQPSRVVREVVREQRPGHEDRMARTPGPGVRRRMAATRGCRQTDPRSRFAALPARIRSRSPSASRLRCSDARSHSWSTGASRLRRHTGRRVSFVAAVPLRSGRRGNRTTRTGCTSGSPRVRGRVVVRTRDRARWSRRTDPHHRW